MHSYFINESQKSLKYDSKFCCWNNMLHSHRDTYPFSHHLRFCFLPFFSFDKKYFNSQWNESPLFCEFSNKLIFLISDVFCTRRNVSYYEIPQKAYRIDVAGLVLTVYYYFFGWENPYLSDFLAKGDCIGKETITMLLPFANNNNNI